MRIPGSKVYRAFPELDRYRDDQCRRFVASANRGFWRKVVAAACILSVLIPCWFGAGYVTVEQIEPALFSNVDGGPSTVRVILLLLAAIALFVVGALPPLVVRDFLLRIRISSVLRDRGFCLVCRYRLVGLPVTTHLGRATVACPECATVCDVDPSLGELVLADDGKGHFSPSIAPESVFWSPARRKRARKVAVVGSILLVLVLAIPPLGYELFLRWQAGAAAAERVSMSTIEAMVTARRPRGIPLDAPNAIDILRDASEKMDAVDRNTWRSGANDPQWDGFPDPTLIYFPSSIRPLGAGGEDDVKSRDIALRLMPLYREAGVMRVLDSIAAAPRADRPLVQSADPMISILLPDLGAARRLARLNRARMSLVKTDDPEYLAAFESNLALARATGTQAFSLEFLVGISIEELALRSLEHFWRSSPSAASLDALQAALDRQHWELPLADALKVESLMVQDTLAFFFEKPGNARLGKHSPALRTVLGYDIRDASAGDDVSLGTLRSNLDALALITRIVDLRRQQPRRDRPPFPDPLPGSDLILIRALASSGDRIINEAEMLLRERLALRTRIALERFRIDHGSYPETLEALVPRYLAEVPIDPVWRVPFAYRLASPEDAPLVSTLGYVLWSRGNDDVDDGGRRDIRRPDLPIVPGGPGADHVFGCTIEPPTDR